MPLYKFECETCGHQFEVIVIGDKDPVKCPKCGSTKCKKLVGNVNTSSCCSVSSPKRRG